MTTSLNPEVFLVARDIILETGWVKGNPYNTGNRNESRNCIITALANAVERVSSEDYTTNNKILNSSYNPILQSECARRFGDFDLITINDKRLKSQEDVVALFEAAYRRAKKENS